MLANGLWTGVVGSERELHVAEFGEHHRKVSRGPVEVFAPVMRVDTEHARGVWHELAETDGSGVRERINTIGTLDFDIGAEEVEPVCDGDIGGAQSAVPCVTKSDLFNAVQYVWVRDHALRDDYCSQDLICFATRLSEERHLRGGRALSDAVIVVAGERTLRL